MRHVETLSNAIAEGAREVEDTPIDNKRVPGLIPRELAEGAGAKPDQDAPVAEPGEFACDDSMSTLTPIEARSVRKPAGKYWPCTRS